MVNIPLILIIVAHLYIVWLIIQAYKATTYKRRKRK